MIKVTFLVLGVALTYLAFAESRPQSPPVEFPLDPAQLFLAQHNGSRPQQDLPQSRNFWRDQSKKWPKGRIPYVVSPAYTAAEKQVITAGMKEWESKTCVRFVPKGFFDMNYVLISPNEGPGYCSCHVGRIGGKQIMQMFGVCLRHHGMIHELGHLIGMNHEHQRPDRDDFITVHYQNIDPAWHFAYEKYGYDSVDNLGTPYDYSSVMQYPYYAYTNVYDPAKPAMTLKDGSIQRIETEAPHLSPTDIAKVQKYYNNCA